MILVSIDTLRADHLGCYGYDRDTSPNIDAFARTALKFNHAHVLVGNCMPGRNIMWSGLFSHVNGVEGFVQNKNPDYPVLCDLARDAGIPDEHIIVDPGIGFGKTIPKKYYV